MYIYICILYTSPTISFGEGHTGVSLNQGYESNSTENTGFHNRITSKQTRANKNNEPENQKQETQQETKTTKTTQQQKNKNNKNN